MFNTWNIYILIYLQDCCGSHACLIPPSPAVPHSTSAAVSPSQHNLSISVNTTHPTALPQTSSQDGCVLLLPHSHFELSLNSEVYCFYKIHNQYEKHRVLPHGQLINAILWPTLLFIAGFVCMFFSCVKMQYQPIKRRPFYMKNAYPSNTKDIEEQSSCLEAHEMPKRNAKNEQDSGATKSPWKIYTLKQVIMPFRKVMF